MEEHQGRSLASFDDVNLPAGSDLDVPTLRRRIGKHPLMDSCDLIRMRAGHASGYALGPPCP